MVGTRSVFRFTIGQGMAVIAALAVTFAYLPMPAAIAFAILTSSLLVLRRNPQLNPALGESIGCLSCLLGFLAGVILGVGWANPPAYGDGLAILNTAFCYGAIGAMAAGIFGHFVALKLSGPPLSRDPSEARREAVRAEIELVDRLLVQAEEDVRMKLAAYKAGLEQELQL